MCYLRFATEERGALVARAAAARSLLWKRSAYNFVSLAHTPDHIDWALQQLGQACQEVGQADR